MAFLMIKDQNGKFEIPIDADPFVIGRSSKCDHVLTDPAISRRHCQIEAGNHGFRLTDLKSKTGVRVNGLRVGETMLRQGDRILIGDVIEAVFEEVSFSANSESPTIKAEVPSILRDGKPVPRLVGLDGPLFGKIFDLRGEVTRLGRAGECDICLPFDTISKRHAAVVFNGKNYQLQDLNSGNGTHVNGKRISSHELKSGDEFCLDELGFRFEWGPLEGDSNVDEIHKSVRLNHGDSNQLTLNRLAANTDATVIAHHSPHFGHHSMKDPIKLLWLFVGSLFIGVLGLLAWQLF